MLAVICGLCLQADVFSQEVEATLSFKQDSVFVGEVVQLDFVIRHPSDVIVAFPDSGPVFRPFEVVKMVSHLTRTRDGISADTLSVYLRTFLLHPNQYFQLPFYYLLGKDTVRKKVRSDTISIKHQIFSLAPPPPLKSREQIIPISTPPDYRMWAIIALIGVLAGAGITLGLRKPIRQFLARRRIKQEWQQLSKNLSQLNASLDRPDTFLDLLNQHWKAYLDPKHRFSLRSLTTKELAQNLPQVKEIAAPARETLLQIAQKGDMAIYAGQPTSKEDLKNYQQAVRQILAQVFKNRLKALSS